METLVITPLPNSENSELHERKNDRQKLASYISMSLHEWKNDLPKLAPYISMSLCELKNDPSKLGLADQRHISDILSKVILGRVRLGQVRLGGNNEIIKIIFKNFFIIIIKS